MKKKYRYSVDLYHTLLNPPRRLYRYIFRPTLFGAKCLIQCGEEFLIARISYGPKVWVFPGGKMEKNETPEQTMKREVMEEVGVKVEKSTYLGIYTSEKFYHKGGVHCFHAIVEDKTLDIDPQEIAEAKWVKYSEIPNEERGSGIDKVLTLYHKHYGHK